MSPGQLLYPPRLTGLGALLENGTENSKKCKQLLEEYIFHRLGDYWCQSYVTFCSLWEN